MSQSFTTASLRALIALALWVGFVAYGATKTQSDEDLTKALVGTWIHEPSELAPMSGKVTYFADEHGVELIWRKGQPESSALRIDTEWSITNSILILTSVKCSNPQVPVGVTIKDHILSISDDRLVFEPADGYGDIEKKRHVRIRQKGGAH